jgi:CubicO group peptidase (beta-lactamase class C family)
MIITMQNELNHSELNQIIQTCINELVASGEEVGLQVAAFVDSTLVVDAWAGVADEASGRLVDGDTLFTSWSTTKGFVATCMHILADRNLIDYDAPVSTYWPEFATGGRETITIRHLLTHKAGLPQMPDGVTAEMMTDWDAMCCAIASHTPLWQPGTKTGYHAWTFSWLLGEVIRRVDGRPIAQFAYEELCQPLGIEGFYLGLPDGLEDRVAPVRQEAAHAEAASQGSELKLRAMPVHITTAEVVNRPDIRRAVIPGGGGMMNARAIARHYAMLANHGILDGMRILSAERVDMIRTLQTDEYDLVSDARIRKGLGYFLGGDPAQGGSVAMGNREGVFGHGGNGGSQGFADPERKFAFGLTKNLMKANPEPKKATAYTIAETIRNYLDRAA